MDVRTFSDTILKCRVTPAPLTFLYPSLSIPMYQHRHRRIIHPSRKCLSTSASSPASAKPKSASARKNKSTEPSILSTAPNSRIAQLLKADPADPPQSRKSSADLLEESFASRNRVSRAPQGSTIPFPSEANMAAKEKGSEKETGEPSPGLDPPPVRARDRSESMKTSNPYRAINHIEQNPLNHYERYNHPLAPASLSARTIKSSPMLGRLVNVKYGDVGLSLKFLDVLCQRENVKIDSRTQKYYERPGAKRKRLRRVRHKSRFGHAFRATVERVKEMRKKGW